MLSQAFKRGFWRGFTAPANLFAPSRLPIPEPVRVEDAWEQVGQAMAEAMGIEGEGSAGQERKTAAQRGEY